MFVNIETKKQKQLYYFPKLKKYQKMQKHNQLIEWNA